MPSSSSDGEVSAVISPRLTFSLYEIISSNSLALLGSRALYKNHAIRPCTPHRLVRPYISATAQRNITAMHSFVILYFVTVLFSLAVSGVPLPAPEADNSIALYSRQSIKDPLGINITDLDLGDISPIEDGFLELDNDSGGSAGHGSQSLSNANGYLGSVGSGQTGTNNEGTEGSDTACSESGCHRSLSSQLTVL